MASPHDVHSLTLPYTPRQGKPAGLATRLLEHIKAAAEGDAGDKAKGGEPEAANPAGGSRSWESLTLPCTPLHSLTLPYRSWEPTADLSECRRYCPLTTAP